MLKNNKLSLLMALISLGLLGPGVYLPMLNISILGNIDAQFRQFDVALLNQSRSILETVKELCFNDYKFVAIAIFLFSVVIPVSKGFLILTLILRKKLSNNLKKRGIWLLDSIGKWSMCDVFIVAIYLVFLSTQNNSNKSEHNLSLMGFSMKIKTDIMISSSLELGFYLFFAYCLCSLLSIQFFDKDKYSD